MNTKTTKGFIAKAAMTLFLCVLTSTAVSAEEVEYIDASGVKQTHTNPTVLTNSMTTLSAGWYVVKNTVSFSSVLNLSGDVDIILADGAEMSITSYTDGIDASGSLTIYGQSAGTGKLSIEARGAAEDNGMGIYAYNISINGGIITIKSMNDGIHTDAGNVNINGGIVNVSPITEVNTGICNANGDINISGGKVSVSSTNTINDTSYHSIIFANGNINLGCKNESDYIFAYSYKVSTGKKIIIKSELPIIDGKTLYGKNYTFDSQELGSKTFAPDLFGMSSGNDGTSKPYTITSREGLQLLATFVNNGESFYDSQNNDRKNFKLCNDINMNGIAFEPIGIIKLIGGTNYEYPFCGAFNGEGHTVSNVTISKDYGTIGLFGYLSNGATVKNIIVDHRTFSGNDTGGIAGYNENSTVTNCIVRNAQITGNVNAGAIIGYNQNGTVTNCIVRNAQITGNAKAGAIIGYNQNGTVTNCIVCNAQITGNVNAGAIIGYNQNGTLMYNYYSNCTANNANTNIGCNSSDIPDNDGARSVTNATIISETTSKNSWPSFAKDDELFFYREFTGGTASTICMPFAYTPNASDGTFYTFEGITTETKGNKTEYVATMQENIATSPLSANTPYLFMPAGTDTKLTDTKLMMFHGPAAASKGDTDAEVTTKVNWTFKGTYDVVTWESAPLTPTYGFSAQNVGAQSISQGQFVKVGEYVKIRSLRAYLQYTGNNFPNTRGTLSEEELPDRILVRLVDSDGDITGIGKLDMKTGEVTFDNGWYTLEGVRLSGKPAKHGIYVNNGRKYMIK